MVAPIIDLLKFNPSSLFPDEKRDWGCEAHVAAMKEDPQTRQHYYEVIVNGTVVRQYCPYKDRNDLVTLIERRRNGLERAVGVYMEEGPISTSDITLPAGLPGCQTKNYKFQHNARKPSWDEITKYETHFLVIFNSRKELMGTYDGPVKISPHTEKYARFYNGEWFVGDSREQMDLTSGCKHGDGEDNKICILGLVLNYNAQNGFLTLSKDDFNVSKESFPSLTTDMIGSLIAHIEWPSDYIFQLKEVVGYLPCNAKWSNVLRFDPSNQDGKCLHLSASSKGNIFVIFAAVPNNKDTWYYIEISPYGVGIFKSQRLMVSTIDVNAVGLGADILYQSYFVCLKETSQSTVIEYGKSQGTTESGDVYLTMIDRDDPLFVRFYSFGNGEEPLEIVDAHIISRHLTKANCKGGTVLDNQTNMCVQNCHPLCDPTQGCRGSSGGKPLPTNCNACRYVKNAVTGECLKECPQGWDKMEDNTCRNIHPCNGVQCLNGGTCRNLEGGKFKCDCPEGVIGQYCEGNVCGLNPCLNGATCTNLPDAKYSCRCTISWKGKRCDERTTCYSNPRLNGGNCTDEKGSGIYSCHCASDWIGKNCAEPNPKGLEVSTIVGSKKLLLGNLTSYLRPVARNGYHWAICWRASKDGWTPARFHSLCDGKGPTVTIVKMKEYTFGG